MHVHDVALLLLEHAAHLPAEAGREGDARHRSGGRQGDRPPDHVHARVLHVGARGREDQRLLAVAGEALGELLDVVVDPPRGEPVVGGDERDLHRRTAPRSRRQRCPQQLARGHGEASQLLRRQPSRADASQPGSLMRDAGATTLLDRAAQLRGAGPLELRGRAADVLEEVRVAAARFGEAVALGVEPSRLRAGHASGEGEVGDLDAVRVHVGIFDRE